MDDEKVLLLNSYKQKYPAFHTFPQTEDTLIIILRHEVRSAKEETTRAQAALEESKAECILLAGAIEQVSKEAGESREVKRTRTEETDRRIFAEAAANDARNQQARLEAELKYAKEELDRTLSLLRAFPQVHLELENVKTVIKPLITERDEARRSLDTVTRAINERFITRVESAVTAFNAAAQDLHALVPFTPEIRDVVERMRITICGLH